MPNQLISLTERIKLLLEELDSGQAPERARLEHTLTDGYAWALKLEGECGRIERRISEVAATLASGGEPSDAAELPSLSRRLARRRRDLEALRTLLATLRAGRARARVA
jgi:hypothetical protein